MKDETDFLKNLQIGQRLNKILFAVAKIEPRTAKNGNPFILLRVGDRMGYCNCYVWVKDEKEQSELLTKIKVGDVVAVTGYFDKFQEGSIKIEMQKGGTIQVIPSCEYDIRDFRATTSKNIREMIDEIKSMINNMQNESLRCLCDHFTNDSEFLKSFQETPGAESKHHNYTGGLLTHTYEVMKVCKLIVSFHPELDEDLLLTGALLHDIGKIESYRYEGAAVVSTDKNNLIGHTPIGSMLVKEGISKIRNAGGEFSQELENNVLHLILSHHGQIDLGYGSPINPKTPESIVLFHADNLDSQSESATADLR